MGIKPFKLFIKNLLKTNENIDADCKITMLLLFFVWFNLYKDNESQTSDVMGKVPSKFQLSFGDTFADGCHRGHTFVLIFNACVNI